MALYRQIAALILLIAVGVYSHDYINCVNYQGTIGVGAYNAASCPTAGGVPRNTPTGGGYTVQNNVACSTTKTAGTTLASLYGNNANNIPKYQEGDQIGITWASLHTSASNININYVCNGPAADPTFTTFQTSGTAVTQAYQGKCNAGGTNCGATMTITPNMVGTCTFVWSWPFGGTYTGCWDAQITALPTEAPEGPENNGGTNGDGSSSSSASSTSGGSSILGINTSSVPGGNATVIAVPIVVIGAAAAFFYIKKRNATNSGTPQRKGTNFGTRNTAKGAIQI